MANLSQLSIHLPSVSASPNDAIYVADSGQCSSSPPCLIKQTCDDGDGSCSCRKAPHDSSPCKGNKSSCRKHLALANCKSKNSCPPHFFCCTSQDSFAHSHESIPPSLSVEEVDPNKGGHCHPKPKSHVCQKYNNSTPSSTVKTTSRMSMRGPSNYMPSFKMGAADLSALTKPGTHIHLCARHRQQVQRSNLAWNTGNSSGSTSSHNSSGSSDEIDFGPVRLSPDGKVSSKGPPYSGSLPNGIKSIEDVTNGKAVVQLKPLSNLIPVLFERVSLGSSDSESALAKGVTLSPSPRPKMQHTCSKRKLENTEVSAPRKKFKIGKSPPPKKVDNKSPIPRKVMKTPASVQKTDKPATKNTKVATPKKMDKKAATVSQKIHKPATEKVKIISPKKVAKYNKMSPGMLKKKAAVSHPLKVKMGNHFREQALKIAIKAQHVQKNTKAGNASDMKVTPTKHLCPHKAKMQIKEKTSAKKPLVKANSSSNQTQPSVSSSPKKTMMKASVQKNTKTGPVLSSKKKQLSIDRYLRILTKELQESSSTQSDQSSSTINSNTIPSSQTVTPKKVADKIATPKKAEVKTKKNELETLSKEKAHVKVASPKKAVGHTGTPKKTGNKTETPCKPADKIATPNTKKSEVRTSSSRNEEDRTSTPKKATDMTLTPKKFTDKTPTPKKVGDKISTPKKATDTTPKKVSDKTSTTKKATDTTTTPKNVSDKTPIPKKVAEKTQTPKKETDKTVNTVTTKKADSTTEIKDQDIVVNSPVRGLKRKTDNDSIRWLQKKQKTKDAEGISTQQEEVFTNPEIQKQMASESDEDSQEIETQIQKNTHKLNSNKLRDLLLGDPKLAIKYTSPDQSPSKSEYVSKSITLSKSKANRLTRSCKRWNARMDSGQIVFSKSPPEKSSPESLQTSNTEESSGSQFNFSDVEREVSMEKKAQKVPTKDAQSQTKTIVMMTPVRKPERYPTRSSPRFMKEQVTKIPITPTASVPTPDNSKIWVPLSNNKDSVALASVSFDESSGEPSLKIQPIAKEPPGKQRDLDIQSSDTEVDLTPAKKTPKIHMEILFADGSCHRRGARLSMKRMLPPKPTAMSQDRCFQEIQEFNKTMMSTVLDQTLTEVSPASVPAVCNADNEEALNMEDTVAILSTTTEETKQGGR